MTNWKEIHPDFTEELQNEWTEWGFTYQVAKEWIEKGLEPEDDQLVVYAKEKGYKSEKINKKELEKEYYQAQVWLDFNYPEETKIDCEVLDISKDLVDSIITKSLEGSLSLKGFTNLKTLYCSGNKLTKLDLKDCLKLEVLECQNNKLSILDIGNFSPSESLDCSKNKLVGLEYLNCENNKLERLNISNSSRLVEVYCSKNQLTNLDCSNLSRLTKLHCQGNQLAQLSLPANSDLQDLSCGDNLLTNLNFSTLDPKKIVDLCVESNNLSTRDLSCLTEFVQLETLYLGTINKKKIEKNIYNRWTGSLEYLKNLTKLKKLEISNTDIDSGVEYLPNSIELITCFLVKKRSESKVRLIFKKLGDSNDFIPFSNVGYLKGVGDEIIKQIKSFDHNKLTFEQELEQEAIIEQLIPNEWLRKHYKVNGLCKECQRINSGKRWCNSCNAKHFQAEFKNWTSGNWEIDKLVQKLQVKAISKEAVLEWIPFDSLTDIECFAEGGFSKIYKAEWIDGWIDNWDNKNNKWQRNKNMKVILKNLNNSQNMTIDFLREVANNKVFGINGIIVRCFGISQDPKTKNYIIVMERINLGNLRQFLEKKYLNKINFSFRTRLDRLRDIVIGLDFIHKEELVHRDLHPGNILVTFYKKPTRKLLIRITDLGLCRPTDEVDKGKIYGVLPYIAPEVLRSQSYTQASDIYSLGIVAFEFLTCTYPYPEMDDMNLALAVCQGYRPNIDELKMPQLLKDLIKKCWDADPVQRPDVSELSDTIKGWIKEIEYEKNTEFYEQYQEIKKEYNHFSQNTPYQIHPTATTTSKLINTKKIAELLKNLSKSEENSSQLTKVKTTKQIKEIEKRLEELKNSLDSELTELVDKFAEAKKKLIKNKKNKEIKVEVRNLGKQLEEKGLSEEKFDEIIRHCENLVELEQQLEKEQLQTNIEIPAKK